MKAILSYLSLVFFASSAQASIHQMAMIQNSVIVNMAVWDDVAIWNPPGYTIIDITNQPGIGIGYTCSLCDGSDFMPPVIDQGN